MKSSGRPKVGISQAAREYIPFSLALDQGDYLDIWGGSPHLPSAAYFMCTQNRHFCLCTFPFQMLFLHFCSKIIINSKFNSNTFLKKSRRGGLMSVSARESIPFSIALDQGDCFSIWGGAPHLPSAPYFTAHIPVLLICWVGEDRYRTRNLVVSSRTLYRLSYIYIYIYIYILYICLRAITMRISHKIR